MAAKTRAFMQSAIKQSTAALSKHKNDYLIRALKCYALAMMGKKDEAATVSTSAPCIEVMYVSWTPSHKASLSGCSKLISPSA